MSEGSFDQPVPASQEVINHEFAEYIRKEFSADTLEQINSLEYQATRALVEFDNVSERLSATLSATVNELRLEDIFATPIEDLLLASEGDAEVDTLGVVDRFVLMFRNMDEEITARMEEGEWSGELIAATLIFATYLDGLNEPEDKAVTLRGVRGIFEELSRLVNPFDAQVIRDHFDSMIWRATANAYSLAENRNLVMRNNNGMFEIGEDPNS